MKLLIAALALSLTVFGQTAFAFESCVTGCWTSEPCYDGYCEDTGQLVGCGDLWAIVQECRPYSLAAVAQASSSNSGRQGSDVGTEKMGFGPSFKRKLIAPNPTGVDLVQSSCWAR
ncbi:MAG: hypothetical protein JF614_03255 [Acidobacteria bacterium]|nr:hypothetical protein [Acidobacteriota bacterium]